MTSVVIGIGLGGAARAGETRAVDDRLSEACSGSLRVA